ncbi:transglycosylase SLT domain-containing protein [Pseudogemmobacter humi]|uniref:Soluble lytic murein transglycosylase n=1 Tax=Pseudogemmobacter humi TaxID=2483812 RepID=A0A3P5XGK2_9RHOB|nr:transglycosylase SLT domain-containing protein [Pseudogemmobacter humi]VDC34014.1 Soluble lytic murein transglycosylase precursor [Pseudogemmobacter humi]
MSRTWLRGISFAALLAAGATASAQGVPTFDAGSFARLMAILEQRNQDLNLQGDRLEREREIAEIERQQLAELERLVGSLSGNAFASGMVSSLENAGPMPASDLYGATDPNPAAERLFGDANVTVEELIVRVAAETHSLPGVGRAGLTLVQWRCLLQALIWQESRFQIGARSPVGAFGLTQIMPGTAGDLGIYPAYYESPYLQVQGGARYLAQMLNMFGGNVIHALAAYNAGPGNVQRYGGVPPFNETQHYVQVIPQKYNEYLRTVGGPDALGTIEPILAAGSHLSLTADASMAYGAHSMVLARMSAERLHAIVSQISHASDVQEAMALNSYARAELARLLTMTMRLRATDLQTISAEQVAAAMEIAHERQFMNLTLRSME